MQLFSKTEAITRRQHSLFHRQTPLGYGRAAGQARLGWTAGIKQFLEADPRTTPQQVHPSPSEAVDDQSKPHWKPRIHSAHRFSCTEKTHVNCITGATTPVNTTSIVIATSDSGSVIPAVQASVIAKAEDQSSIYSSSPASRGAFDVISPKQIAGITPTPTLRKTSFSSLLRDIGLIKACSANSINTASGSHHHDHRTHNINHERNSLAFSSVISST